MIIPAKRLFIIFWLIVAIALAASIWSELDQLWLIVISIAGIILLIDLLLAYRSSETIRVSRSISSSLPLGVDRFVELRVHNECGRHIKLKLFDHHPQEVKATGLPISLSLAKSTHADLSYKIHAIQRGKMEFPYTQIHLQSPLGFWYRNIKVMTHSEVHVYPNFAAVSHYALMATDNKLSQMGIIKKRRRGEGQDFHQLR
ncbi:MAG TPA: DUF58 domain-containing protein, partial [Thiotrichaceae bacterium]|nr:DUF58 domain-containing protein [Thiotrichaceae bacterium]